MEKHPEQEDGLYYYQVDKDTIITFREEDFFEKKAGWSRLVEWFQDDEKRTYILCYRDKKGTVTAYQFKEKASIEVS